MACAVDLSIPSCNHPAGNFGAVDFEGDGGAFGRFVDRSHEGGGEGIGFDSVRERGIDHLDRCFVLRLLTIEAGADRLLA